MVGHLTNHRILLAVALLAAAVGAFSTLLPWVAVPGISAAGHQIDDGRTILGLSLASVVLLSVAVAREFRAASFLGLGLGIASAVLSIYRIVDVQEASVTAESILTALLLSGDSALIEVRGGLYLVAVAALVQSVSSAVVVGLTASDYWDSIEPDPTKQAVVLRRLRALQQSWVLLTFLRRPYSVRDAINRGLVVAAVVAAVVAPIFIGGGGGDATEGASADFAAKLAVAELLRETIDADSELSLDDIIADVRERSEDSSNDADSRAILIERVEQLEQVRDSRAIDGLSNLARDVLSDLNEETGLGYIPRDGDASDKGALAPDFRLLDLEGNPHRLSEIGGPIVLNFWASWCEPCIEEMPEFELVNQEALGRVTFVGVNDGEDLATAREFAYEVTGVTYLVLLDPTKSMTDGPYPLVGRPTTYFIGADGIIKELRVGIVDLETLRELVGELIGEDVGAAEQDAAPADYGEAAINILDSARANYAAAAELIERWREQPQVLTDPGWQRNMQAQTRAWSDLSEQVAALAAPERWSDLHERVSDSMAQIANAAGPLVRDALEAGNADGMETATTLFDTFRDLFDLAADNLQGVIETQQ